MLTRKEKRYFLSRQAVEKEIDYYFKLNRFSRQILDYAYRAIGS